MKLLKMEASCNFCGSISTLAPSCLSLRFLQKRSNLSSFIGSVNLSNPKNRSFLDSISLKSTIRATASSSGGTKAVTTRRRKPKIAGTNGASSKNVKISEIPAVSTKGPSGKVTRKNQQQECKQDTGPVDVRSLNQNGDPLGRKDLGKCVVRWLSQGMRAMASDFVTAEMQGEFAELKQRMEPGLTFVIQAQPYLNAVPMPLGLEAICLKACTHYPTLFDNFQRELRNVLQDLQRKSSIQDWRETESWKLLKNLASSGDTAGNYIPFYMTYLFERSSLDISI